MLPTINNVLIFFIFAIFCILSLRYVKNPIYILLNIVFTFILLSFLLFNQNCELITYTFIIVYLGALMLLFLFIVMLLNIQNIKKNARSFNINLLYFLFFFGCTLFILTFIISTIPIINELHNAQFSALFFNNNVNCNDMALTTLFQKQAILFFVLISILLLFILVSAITTVTSSLNTFKI